MKLLFSAFLICLISGAIALPKSVEHFPGRSADIIVQSDTSAHEDSSIFFKGAQLEHMPEFEDTRFADLFSHVMGLLPFHKDANRNGFPSVDFFNKPKVVAIFAVDAISSETLSKYPSLALLQNYQRMPLATRSFPASTHTLLANLATGSLPSVHGIVGESWRNRYGDKVVAHEPNAGESYAANVADILLQEWRGVPLIVSASSSSTLAPSFTPHDQLSTKYNTFNARAFVVGQSGFTERSSRASPLAASGAAFSALLSRQFFKFVAPSNTDVEFSEGQLRVGDVVFTVKEAELQLLAELAFVYNLAEKISTDLVDLARDDIPDLISIVFASMKGIEAKYGKDSNQIGAALSMIDAAAQGLISRLEEVYSGRVASTFVVTSYGRRNTEVMKDVYKKVHNLVHSHSEFEAQYPAIFTRARSVDVEHQMLCTNMKIDLVGTNVHCFVTTPGDRNFASYELMANGTTNGTTPTPNTIYVPNFDQDSDATVFIFWLMFWFSLAIALFVLWGVYSMCWVGGDASKDSLLFRVAGRHLHQS